MHRWICPGFRWVILLYPLCSRIGDNRRPMVKIPVVIRRIPIQTSLFLGCWCWPWILRMYTVTNVNVECRSQLLICFHVVVKLKEQASDSIMVLEGALNIKKDFYIHTLHTLDLLAADPSTANGETESSTAGLRISPDELHCQVCTFITWSKRDHNSSRRSFELMKCLIFFLFFNLMFKIWLSGHAKNSFTRIKSRTEQYWLKCYKH